MWRKDRTQRGDNPQGIIGPARIDRRTKNLTKRLKPGDIAVIDHVDLDRVSAETLAACQVAAVVNAAKSTSGRYPNVGPTILFEAGIPLIDDVGSEVLTTLREGQHIRIDAGYIIHEGRVVASGVRQDAETIEASLDEARAGLPVQIEAFAANTLEYLRQEKDLLLNGVGVPEVRTDFTDRQVLVVVRGYHYKEDIRALKPYVREYRPIVIGVDGGADALLEQGVKPDMILGDMDSVSDRALACGAELVVHAYRDGRAPGMERIEALGLPAVVFPAAGTSEDVAMLLADEKGATLIVALGTHATLVEFLDKGRAGMASTFLTRLRVGGKLIDAKGVNVLYRQRISARLMVLMVVAGMTSLCAAIAATPTGQTLLTSLGGRWDQFVYWLSERF